MGCNFRSVSMLAASAMILILSQGLSQAEYDNQNKESKTTENEQAFEITAPPKTLNVPAFYAKYISAGGYPVIASKNVNDYALKEAAYLINLMLAKRPDIKKAMIDSGSKMIVIAHNEFTTDIPEYYWLKPKDYWDARARGLGGSRTDPVCSCGEENLLGYQGDPYAAECILIHEFAHNIHLRGLVRIDKTFDARLKTTYDAAMERQLWRGKYASVNRDEYWAEGVQSWFNDNRENDHDHNHVNTRKELKEYDPGLAKLCEEVFGDTALEYTKPSTRLRGHLTGYNPKKAPTFRWPERLDKVRQEIREKAKQRGKETTGKIDTAKTLKVFLLAGQSNMVGQAVVDLDHPKYYNGGKGTLAYLLKDPKKQKLVQHLKQGNDWVVRDDVFIRFHTGKKLRKGKLSIGYTAYDGNHHFGPELQFGHIVGDQFQEPVLLIKTAWGGKSLFKDFRPPSSVGQVGDYYKKMISEIREALSEIPNDFSELKDRNVEIAGFVWFQGWNDMIDKQACEEYESNLANLIKDLRKELKLPDLPVVIGELGNGGPKASGGMQKIREAQAEVARRPEFKGTVTFVKTSNFARPAQESPNVGHGHHWYGNAESYFLIGDALGKAMVELLRKEK